MAHIAYKRVSTTHQETLRQLVNAPVEFDKVFEDKLSGKNSNRPELQKCLETVTEGDTLWVHSIDRLARNVEDLRDIVFKVMDKGVTVKFLKEGLEFVSDMSDAMKSAMSKMLLTLLGAVAEFERAIIVSRVKEGIEVAKSNGVKFGAASDSYQKKLKEGTVNHVGKTRHKKAVSSWEEKRPQIERVINFMKKDNKRLTYDNIGDMFVSFQVETASGDLNWSKQKVQRCLNYLNIQR